MTTSATPREQITKLASLYEEAGKLLKQAGELSIEISRIRDHPFRDPIAAVSDDFREAAQTFRTIHQVITEASNLPKEYEEEFATLKKAQAKVEETLKKNNTKEKKKDCDCPFCTTKESFKDTPNVKVMSMDEFLDGGGFLDSLAKAFGRDKKSETDTKKTDDKSSTDSVKKEEDHVDEVPEVTCD